MKDIDFTGKVIHNIDYFHHVQNTTKRVNKILDANYHKANLVEVTNNCKNLITSERALLKSLLQHYKPMFDRTLGQRRVPDFKIELKEGVKPYYPRPYSVPKIHEETMKKECARMEEIGILRKITGSEWGAPTFIMPKKNTVRFISDFRELNKRIKRKPCPTPENPRFITKTRRL